MDPTNQNQSSSEFLPNSNTPVLNIGKIKPFSLLLEDTVDVVKTRFLNLSIVGLLSMGGMWLFIFMYSMLVFGVGKVSFGMSEFMGGGISIVGFLFLFPLIFVISGFVYASLYGVLETNDIKAAFNFGFSRMFTMALYMVVFFLVLIGSAMVFIVPALFVYIYGIFAFLIAADQGKNGFSALFESYRLIKGNVRAVAGRLFLVVLLGLIVSFISQYFFRADALLGGVINLFLSILMQVFMLSYLYSIYTNLKEANPIKDNYQPSALSRVFTYIFFSLGLLILFVIPLLLMINPAKQINRAREEQMRQMQGIPSIESIPLQDGYSQ